MPGRHRVSQAQPIAVIVGGAVGAVLRHAMTTTWPLPHHVLVSTAMTAGVAFMIAGYLMASGPLTTLRAALLGLVGSAASLSAWAVLTISQTPRLSAAFLVLTPAAAIGGLVCGLLAARIVAR